MKKDRTIEYMRVIACLGVVLIHVLKSAHDIFPEMSAGRLFFCSAIINNLRWCVPVFLMITGGLLLDPGRQIGIHKLFRYVIRIAIVLLVFGTGFAVMELVFNTHTLTPSTFGRAFLNVLQGDTWDHLWYLYTLIVLYLFLPFLRGITATGSRELLRYSCLVIFLFCSVLPLLDSLGLNLGLSGGISSVYMFYMLVGYGIRKSWISLPRSLQLAGLLASVLGLVCLAYAGEYGLVKVKTIWISHASVLVLLQSTCVFCQMQGLRPSDHPGVDRVMLSLADNSFGIYILHMVYINLIYKFFKVNPAEIGIWVFLPVYLVVLAATYTTSVLIRKIPIVKRYL